MKKYLSINEMCALTSVSVRTLHYYDEINMLKPSHRTNKGHRLYAQKDLFCLQKILIFKSLGFTLKQISQLMHDEQCDMMLLLKIQKETLQTELSRIEKVMHFFDHFINNYAEKNQFDWENISDMMALLKPKRNDMQQWYKEYLSKAEIEIFAKFAKTRTEKWQALVQEVKEKITQNPNAEPEAAVAKKWIALADEAYADYPELKNKLWKAWQTGKIPQTFFPFDKEMVDYLTKSFEK